MGSSDVFQKFCRRSQHKSGSRSFVKARLHKADTSRLEVVASPRKIARLGLCETIPIILTHHSEYKKKRHGQEVMIRNSYSLPGGNFRLRTLTRNIDASGTKDQDIYLI